MSRIAIKRRRIPVETWVAFLPVVAVIIAWAQILEHSFMFDDYLHLFNVANGPLHKAIFAPHGGHFLLSYNTIWWLLHRLFGADPIPYYVVVLLAHALNVRLLFGVVRQSTDRLYLAAFAAAAWGLCPILKGTLGWLSVFGHTFATTAVLWILLDIVKVGQRNRQLTMSLVTRWYLLLLFASTSFGVGLGVSVGFGVVIYLLNPEPSKRGRLAIIFGSLAFVLPVLYFLGGWTSMGLTGVSGTEQGFAWASILDAWGSILTMSGKLVSYGTAALLLGPLVAGRGAIVSGEALLAVSLLVGLCSLIGLIFAFVKSSRERRNQLLAFAWLVLSCYGIIAVGRYDFDNWQSARYHYLGPALLSILLCLAISTIPLRQAWAQRWAPRLFVFWLLAIIVPYTLGNRVVGPYRLMAMQVQEKRSKVIRRIQNTVASSTPGSEVYLQNYPFSTRAGFGKGQFPGWAALFLIEYPDNTIDGRRVYFVDSSPNMQRLLTIHEDSRLADLIVSEFPQGVNPSSEE